MTSSERTDGEYIKTLAELVAIWSFLHDLFRFPDDNQWQWLHEPRVKQAWTVIRALVSAEMPNDMPLPESFEVYEQDYISAFEVGTPEPPCPLIESHWNKRDAVPKILHENILFYRQFGLILRSMASETADHLRYQLEFNHYLCRMELEAYNNAKSDEILDSIRRGRKDFLDRHMNSWIPRAAQEYGSKYPGSWPAAWMTFLVACCTAQVVISE